ncbi:unnamed protein product [Symbiodinium necroappetens]|uniref:Type II secretion system protein n=1 Tax=Symbiodinium necroappetens TaxID=1628268 RepID=A0A812RGK1_9DINO|nr:unnamed protein product [Symbiodinium necroappetens]
MTSRTFVCGMRLTSTRICAMASTPPRGVTLVELMVALAVVGVLLSITIPAVSGARGAALRTEADSDLRQGVAMMSSYAGASRGLAPFVEPPVSETGEIGDFVRIELPQGGAVGAPYFAQTYFWHTALLARGYDMHGGHWGGFDTFTASQSFLAEAGYWTDRGAQRRESWGVQRLSSVTSPASKALLYQRSSSDVAASPVGFVDGHVARESRSAAGPWVVNRLWDFDSGKASAMKHTRTVLHALAVLSLAGLVVAEPSPGNPSNLDPCYREDPLDPYSSGGCKGPEVCCIFDDIPGFPGLLVFCCHEDKTCGYEQDPDGNARSERERLGRMPEAPLSADQVTRRVEDCVDLLASRFRESEESRALSDEQVERLAQRAGACLTELMTGTVESYSDLMMAWGGELKDTNWSRPEHLANYWTRNQNLYPFYSYDLESMRLESPTVRPGGLTIVRTESEYAYGEQRSAWTFPDIGPVQDHEREVRFVTIDVTSKNGNVGTVEMWWQWSHREAQWMPMKIRYYADGNNTIPAMVF